MMVKTKMRISILLGLLMAACSSGEGNQAAKSASSPVVPQAASGTASGDMKRLAITAIAEHVSLNEVREGVLVQLKAEGFEEGKNLSVDYQSANGNTGTAAQIAKKFAGDKPDVIVPIGTPSAQAVLAASKELPIVFSAVTDPIAAKLVPSWQPSGTNVTGMSNQQDIAPEVALIKELVPDVKAIGYVYSPGEVNSVMTLKHLQAEAQKHGISVVEAPAQTTAEVLTAARSLQGKVQVIYTGHDNNVVASYPSMYKAAVEMQIPLVASDGNAVGKGAVAAMGVNYVDLGKETGKMVAQIFRGEKAGNIAPRKVEYLELVVSLKHAKEQGITLPETVKHRAAKIME